MKKMKIALLLLTSIVLLSCKKEHIETKKSNITEKLSYKHTDGTICHAQSPINILTFRNNKAGKHNITFKFKDEINAIENLGHTVQLNFKKGSTITVNDEVFEFKQLHFHTSSEHLLDGVQYPMEIHMVNTLQGQKEGETPEYLVIGVLFKMGQESKFINKFINSIPKEVHSTKSVKTGEITIMDLVSEKPENLLESYYHYMGSLTTPPYTESVRWYLTKHIFEASPEQINKILKIEGANSRQVQGLNQREVENY